MRAYQLFAAFPEISTRKLIGFVRFHLHWSWSCFLYSLQLFYHLSIYFDIAANVSFDAVESTWMASVIHVSDQSDDLMDDQIAGSIHTNKNFSTDRQCASESQKILFLKIFPVKIKDHANEPCFGIAGPAKVSPVKRPKRARRSYRDSTESGSLKFWTWRAIKWHPVCLSKFLRRKFQLAVFTERLAIKACMSMLGV